MSHFLALNFSKSRQRKKSTTKITKFLILGNLVIPNQTVLEKFLRVYMLKFIDHYLTL